MKYQAPYGVLDPNAGYVNGDPSIGRAGSIPPAAAFEEPMREIVQCITGTGLTPSDADLTQLWKAMQIAPWIQEYCVDTGSANVYSASLTPAPTQMYVGMQVAVKIANDCTGPCTLNINGLGAHAIKRATGANPNAGDLKANQVACFVYDGANWQIINFLGFTSDTTVNNFTTQIPFATDTGAVNAVVGVFSPAITVLAAGNPFLVKVSNTNTGPVTVKCNSLTAVQLVWPDQSQLAAGDIVNGGLIFIVFDGVKMQLLCRINAGGGGPPATTGGVPGTIDLWPTETAPAGSYECDGRTLSTVDDSRLYGILGGRYGMVDPSHFKIPDFRGYFTRGWSHSSGNDPDAATRTDRGDGTAGDKVGTKQADSLVNHSHTVSISGSTGGVVMDNSSGGLYGFQHFQNGGDSLYQLEKGLSLSGVTVSTSGGGAETRPKNINMMYIIWR